MQKLLIFHFKAVIIIFIFVFNDTYVKTNNILLFLIPFVNYVNACKHSKILYRKKILNKHPYISVCLSALNMELYIKQNLLSILNQSFQDFEIIIVNDFSRDQTENIIRNLQSKDNRIKLVNHCKNLGVYHSRIEAIFKCKWRIYFINGP